MDRLTIYRITVYAGSETAGTLHIVHRECIALHNTKNLENVARLIMTAHAGNEVDCCKITSAQIAIMD